MLSHIQIRDFAIIDAVEIELSPGLTVLTGETGAGKSILVDALLLAAGGRAGADLIRHGADRAEVTATFTLGGNAEALAWLCEQAIEHDGECVLRRTAGVDGRSRGWINGQSMPIQSVRQLAEMLLDVHGQMEYQSLMRRPAQRSLLDRHGGHDELTTRVTTTWRRLRSLREERAAAATSVAERGTRLDLLRYHTTELEALDLKPGEPDALVEERQRLSHHGRLVAGATEMAALLSGDEAGNAEQLLARALTVARGLVPADAAVAPLAQLLEESLIGAREAALILTRYSESLEADPTRQEWLESRLAAIEALARKHRCEPAALEALHQSFQRDIEELQNFEVRLERIDGRLADAEREFLSACERLSSARRASAAALSANVTTLMQGLGMPGGRFEVSVHRLEAEAAGEYGQDAVEFLVSANPGQPLRPLAKVASGGELSRISLAIQVAAVQEAALPCLIFDEVDAGVGGGVAEIVGRQLRALGERAQVLCVTHLPQVASQAHQHFRVVKLADARTTRTTLTHLDTAGRVEEIARMLGGVDVTDTAREHAAEMLKAAERLIPRRAGTRKRNTSSR